MAKTKDCVAGLDALAREKTVLLTTFRREGTAVATPVHIAPGEGVAYARTFEPSGKLKRLPRSPARAAPARGTWLLSLPMNSTSP